MKPLNFRNIAKRLWLWIFILTVLIGIWPIEYGITRAAFAVGVATIWLGALILWWSKRRLRFTLLTLAGLGVLLVALPGRPLNSKALAADYAYALRCFRGVRYVWGGEGFLGIDCSGLPRKALIWAQFFHGIRTLNGTPIRSSLDIWAHDSSARALRDGYRGWTREIFRHDDILGADHTKLKAGDLAITADGVHALAYLGNRTWIEADPGLRRVTEITLPTENGWFRIPVVFVRWNWNADQ